MAARRVPREFNVRPCLLVKNNAVSFRRPACCFLAKFLSPSRVLVNSGGAGGFSVDATGVFIQHFSGVYS
jgi:hypothetical protein